MRERANKGFTIIEVVVGLAIIAIISSIVLSTVSTYVSHQNVETAATTLKDLGSAIRTFKTAVGNYPSRLSDLTTAVVSTDKTSCSTANPTVVTFGATNAAKWTIAAPFYWKTLPRTGFTLSIGSHTADALTRTSTNTTAGFLQILIQNVRVVDARELNRLIDGETDVDAANGSNSGGAVQWSAPTSDKVDVTYNVPVGASC